MFVREIIISDRNIDYFFSYSYGKDFWNILRGIFNYILIYNRLISFLNF